MRQIFVAAFRQRRIILVALAPTLLLAAAGAWLLPDSYESRMKMLVMNARLDVVVTPERTGGRRRL